MRFTTRTWRASTIITVQQFNDVVLTLAERVGGYAVTRSARGSDDQWLVGHF